MEDKLATFINLEFEVYVQVRMGTYFRTARIHIDFGYYLQHCEKLNINNIGVVLQLDYVLDENFGLIACPG